MKNLNNLKFGLLMRFQVFLMLTKYPTPTKVIGSVIGQVFQQQVQVQYNSSISLTPSDTSCSKLLLFEGFGGAIAPEC